MLRRRNGAGRAEENTPNETPTPASGRRAPPRRSVTADLAPFVQANGVIHRRRREVEHQWDRRQLSGARATDIGCGLGRCAGQRAILHGDVARPRAVQLHPADLVESPHRLRDPAISQDRRAERAQQRGQIPACLCVKTMRPQRSKTPSSMPAPSRLTKNCSRNCSDTHPVGSRSCASVTPSPASISATRCAPSFSVASSRNGRKKRVWSSGRKISSLFKMRNLGGFRANYRRDGYDGGAVFAHATFNPASPRHSRRPSCQRRLHRRSSGGWRRRCDPDRPRSAGRRDRVRDRGQHHLTERGPAERGAIDHLRAHGQSRKPRRAHQRRQAPADEGSAPRRRAVSCFAASARAISPGNGSRTSAPSSVSPRTSRPPGRKTRWISASTVAGLGMCLSKSRT